MKIKVSQVILDREQRQRSEISNIEDLAESISRLGLLNPIILNKGHKLIAGERRLEAHKFLGIKEIEVRYVETLDPDELSAIELEENVKREELPWQDKVRAYAKLADYYGTITKTAERIGVDRGDLSRMVAVSKELDDPMVSSAHGVRNAHNIISRRQQREIDSELSKLGEVELDESSKDLPSSNDVIEENFLKWAPSYEGRRFNVIHCDFPYGIDFHDSSAGRANQYNTYNDSPETYYELVECFIQNFENFALPSAHVMFWYSQKYEQWTREEFRKAGFRIYQYNLIWHKTDNKGIVSDVERTPRHVYESALFLSKGDRKIIKCVSDTYGAPTSKIAHLSEKPVPVLSYFFRMFVDPLAEVLDPTCGGGSALIAAERLGAQRVLGLDISPENCEIARESLATDRRLRQYSQEGET